MTNERHKRDVISKLNCSSPLVYVPGVTFVTVLTTIISIPILAAAYKVGEIVAQPRLAQVFAVIAIMISGAIWLLTTRMELRSQNSLWLTARGFILRWWNPSPDRSAHLIPLPFAQVGHCIIGRPNRITLFARLDGTYRIPVSRFTIDDEADKIFEHFARHAPDQLFSIDDAGNHRYSRDWNLASLLPDTPRLSTLRIHQARPDSIRISLTSGDEVWEYHQGTGIVHRGATRIPTLKILQRRRILFGAGVVIASANRVQSYTIEFRFGSDETLTVGLRTRKILWNGEPAGTFTGETPGDDGSSREVQFTQPIPAIAVVLAAVTVAAKTGKLG